MTYRIICGDAEKEVDKLDEKSVDVIFTSPTPPITLEEIKKLVIVFLKMERVLKDTGSIWVQMPDYHDADGNMRMVPETFAIMMKAQYFLRSKAIWIRNQETGYNVEPEERNRLIRDWEYLFFFTKNRNGYYYNYNSKYKSSVYSFPYHLPKQGSFESGFPEGLIEIAIENTCPSLGHILDPFCGTGVTGIVATSMKRDFTGIEIDPDKISKLNKRLRMQKKNHQKGSLR
ncbi:MAG: site-specific DNA-methyltransferase [Candidatus Nitrosocosmicus sp.]